MGLGEKIGIYWPVCLNLVVVESDVSCNPRPDQAKVKVLRLVLRHSPFCRCVKIFLKKTRKQKRPTRFLILTRDERKKKTSSQTLEEKRGRWTKKRSRQFPSVFTSQGRGEGQKAVTEPSWQLTVIFARFVKAQPRLWRHLLDAKREHSPASHVTIVSRVAVWW